MVHSNRLVKASPLIDRISIETSFLTFGNYAVNVPCDIHKGAYTLSWSHTFVIKGTTYTMTAEEMGYQKYFDEWKALGILN
ncbi:hypothetical protein AMD01_05495 [Priestia koreensis]|uniref:Uncharacterized protein n=1 Tax=Priestia koreensis TaxID=284581 RepID=A0A0M0L900_9BACI|nr:hypothetical protein AMD01_05495 [Priestia koreensis]